jgi:hypothetical protein
VPEDVPPLELVGSPVDPPPALDDVDGEADPHAARTAPHTVETATATRAWRACASRLIEVSSAGSNGSDCGA